MNILRLLAADDGKITPADIGITDPTTSPVLDANQALANILNTTYMWAGIICVLIIIVAGFFYVTANGNPSQVKRGKDAITGAIIGLIVVMMAFVITKFVIGRF
jgi:uncharacterized membrane protein YagU involved in acid resistance